MKWVFIVIPTLLFSNCVMIGTNMIHSPTADEGIPVKYRYVHGGATSNAPPDAIIFQVDDSTNILVKARTIWEKKILGGIIIPFYPLYWLPRINFYEEQPNSLIIALSSWNNDSNVAVNSATLVAKGNSYRPRNITIAGSTTVLNFPLTAEQTTDFKLTNLSILVNVEQRNLPEIRFEKMKQNWYFLGP